MISNKMKSQMGGEAVIREMFEKGIEMKREYGAENVFDFSLGNPNVPAPDAVREEAEGILEKLPPAKIHSYMPNAGFPEVRVEVAKHLNKRYGTSYSEENIVMTAGAGSALNLIFKTIIDIDDEVIVLAPFFAEYKGYVENYYGKIVIVPPLSDGSFLPDLDALGNAVTDKTKAVIVNTPNNPTGAVYSEEVIKGIAEVLSGKEKELGRPIYLVSDEPYREIVFEGGEIPWIPDYYDDTLVTYSYSKALSIPGERIGEIVIPHSVSGFSEFVSAVTTANLLTGVVNAPSLMQLVIARCIDEKSDVGFYKENARLIYDIVTKTGFKALKPQGAFYLWMEAPGGDDRAFSEMAVGKKILMVPGSAFAGPGYVRLSYCVSRETIEGSEKALIELAKEAGL